MGTQRAKAELDVLFADNDIGSITPAKLRDFVESAKPSRGVIHFVDPGTPTTIATIGAFVKASNTSTLESAFRCSMPDANRIRYDGVATSSAILAAALSFTCAANNQVLAFTVARNGVVLPNLTMNTKIATGADIQALAVVGDGEISTGDFVEIWLANLTSTASVTISQGYVRLFGFLS